MSLRSHRLVPQPGEFSQSKSLGCFLCTFQRLYFLNQRCPCTNSKRGGRPRSTLASASKPPLSLLASQRLPVLFFYALVGATLPGDADDSAFSTQFCCCLLCCCVPFGVTIEASESEIGWQRNRQNNKLNPKIWQRHCALVHL